MKKLLPPRHDSLTMSTNFVFQTWVFQTVERVSHHRPVHDNQSGPPKNLGDR
jgi:hypothetical protein